MTRIRSYRSKHYRLLPRAQWAFSCPVTPKQALRSEIKDRLGRLSAAEIAENSVRICDAIVRRSAWNQALTVCIFAPQPTEPNVELLWQRASGKRVCYPRVNGIDLDLIVVSGPNALSASRWQLREPLHDEAQIVAPHDVDLLLVPGLAFSRDGGRLGRGGGFYDRLLANPKVRASKIGVCFDVQIVDALPVEAHDEQVEEVITESSVAGDYRGTRI
jgi:5-formyltetrahydrofolate cyclo-ligase